MYVRYQRWNDEISREMTMKQIMKLFTHLLTQSAGDVEDALETLDYLGKRYGFFNDDLTPQMFRDYLKEEGYAKHEAAKSGLSLTAKGEQRIRSDAFEEIFSQLKRDNTAGSHSTGAAGEGGETLPETREFRYGDSLNDIQYTRSISNAVRRTGLEDFSMTEEDLEVSEREQSTSCATMMLVDISHSMILYGEDRITPAKKVAMALAEFIQKRYSKDSLDVALFGDDARQVEIRDLPYIQVGPYHTNTKAGLELAQRVLARRKQANKQILMITDGKPSAIFEGGLLYKNSFGLDPKIVNQTINEAVHCRRKGIEITTFMITSDPALKDVVDRITKANKGRAYYASINNLGSFILTDYARNRRKRS